MYRLKRTLSAFVDILFPKTCHICSKDIRNPAVSFDAYICAGCASEMEKNPIVSCSLCAEPLTGEDEFEIQSLICRNCSKDRPEYKNLFACYAYGDKTKELIHRFKYENRPYLAKTLSQLMRNRLKEENSVLLSETDYIVPIPLYPARQREREFNQSNALAIKLSAFSGKPVIPALKKIRNTRPQASLKSKDRLKNMNGAFRLSTEYSHKGKRLLIIDDVVTTTATVREAARILKGSGAASISILAFAKG